MKKYLLLFMLLSLFVCKTANADYYKWEDENGNTQITDYPPPANKSAKDVQIHKYQTEDIKNPQSEDDSTKDTQEGDDQTKDDNNKKSDVVLYTKNKCDDCDKARAFLKSKKIRFTEYNMDTDKNAVIERKKIDDSDDVPFALINKYQVSGFTEASYVKALKVTP